MEFRSNQFGAPEVVKNLIIINVLFFLAKLSLTKFNINLDELFGMFYFQSSAFRPWQMITHFFMHGSLTHLFFNMFGLWMFGSRLEQLWGPKRFLNFYLVTAVGAFLLHFLVSYIEAYSIVSKLSSEEVSMVLNEGRDLLKSGRNYSDAALGKLNGIYNVPIVGASGALFGILAAFAMYFPNTELYLMFIPIPIKAKYFVLFYAGFELFSGISGFQPGIAHFAHLGGALFGFLMVKYWNKNNRKTLF